MRHKTVYQASDIATDNKTDDAQFMARFISTYHLYNVL